MYLVAVLDVYARYLVSWALSDSLAQAFVLQAVSQALHTAKPTIWNSDQGSQFTSPLYIGLLEAAGVQISMDGRGRAFDTIFVERFWRTVKYEDIYLKGYATPRAVRQGLSEYFHKYNTYRPHTALNDQTPAAVYLRKEEQAIGGEHVCR